MAKASKPEHFIEDKGLVVSTVIFCLLDQIRNRIKLITQHLSPASSHLPLGVLRLLGVRLADVVIFHEFF